MPMSMNTGMGTTSTFMLERSPSRMPTSTFMRNWTMSTAIGRIPIIATGMTRNTLSRIISPEKEDGL